MIDGKVTSGSGFDGVFAKGRETLERRRIANAFSTFVVHGTVSS